MHTYAFSTITSIGLEQYCRITAEARMKQLTDYNDNTHSVIAGLQLGVLYEAFSSAHIFGRCHRFGRFNPSCCTSRTCYQCESTARP
ncbi:conserved hypothetical protein [Halomonas sp. 59]|nr:conserved hypothetical protein [Halomonas sp. 156]CAD5287308.1 conserved hypothetical protein [Halomonas sp. 113]CAD5288834.1 conserved hypothetical protein [Halomonas sp. 59]CAD5291815.1 conserved hypothetical protein [Halomonas sp. I3]VXB40922.1 conserved hypothetical protein [Halomonas titanicae]